MFYGSIPALITPFNENYDIDYESLESLLEMHLKQGSNAIVIAGTTGESPTLSSQEIDELVVFCKQKLGSSIPIIVGTGSNCTRSSIARTKRARELGADGALVIIPYYNKPTDEGCLEHVKQVAHVGLPVIAYHHPGRTGKTLSLESLVALTKIKHVVGLKEASGASITTKKILEQAPSANILSGDDPLTLELIEMGACGSISIIANLYPSIWANIVSNALKSQHDVAQKQYQQIKEAIQTTLLEPNPIGIKKVMSEHNMCQNVLRLPLVAAKRALRVNLEPISL